MRRLPEIATISFGLFRSMKSLARATIVAAAFATSVSFAQAELDTRAAREQRLLDQIAEEEATNGPYSEGLIDPLSELSLLYDEIGAVVPAEEAIERALTVIRANNGFESLEQAPYVRRLIAREEERGNARAAWELSEELMMLGVRNPDDIRSAGIFREMGDKRMEILRRYDTGEVPPEIIFGCFYDDTLVHAEARLRGSQPMNTVSSLDPLRSYEIPTKKCGAGDRSHARRMLAESALSFYRLSVNVLRRSGNEASTEMPELLMTLVRNSYLFTNPSLGTQSLRLLLDYEDAYADDWLPRIETRVLLGDWDMIYAADFGTRYVESALATYEEAHQLAVENGLDAESIEQLFSPEIPVMLPAFFSNPLVTEETPLTRGFIDVSFVVSANGKTRRVDVIESSGDVPRAVEKDLLRMIKFNRFRPLMTDGEFRDSAPIVLRYYVN